MITCHCYPSLLRPKNISSVLLKSAIDTVISAICFYLVGYAFEMGQGPNPNGEAPSLLHGRA